MRLQLGRWALLGFYLGALGPALAAGYGLHEASVTATGAAFAGAAASDSDASFLTYNPAASAAATGPEISVAAIGILASSSARYDTVLTSASTPVSGDRRPKDFINDALVPQIALRTRLDSKWSAGLVVYAPWGLATSYQHDSAERYYAESTKLTTINLTPSLAYRVSPNLVLSAGIQVQYAKGSMSNAVDVGTLAALMSVPGAMPGAADTTARFSGSSWAVGYVLGGIARLSHSVTLGLSYVSSLHHDIDGKLDFRLDPGGLGAAVSTATGLLVDTPAKAALTTPAIARLGLRWTFAPQWTALFDLDWTDWTSFQRLTVKPANPVQPNDITAADWNATWMTAIGAEYRADERWTYRAGIAIDPSPIPDSTLGPRIPDGDRTYVSAGFTYRANAATDFMVAAEHLFIADRKVRLNPAQSGNALRGTLIGRTQSAVNVLAVQFVHRFE